MSLESYLDAARRLDLSTICVTNHGNMADYHDLAAVAPAELTIVPGVEISSTLGDFLVFSGDFAFLESLTAAQPLPPRGRRPRGTAIVWAHPFAGNPGGCGASETYLASIAAEVDGIEVFNGNWPDGEASVLARRFALDHGLAELGGSDAHDGQNLMRCWTWIEQEIRNSGDLVGAILGRKTVAGRK